MLHTIHANNPTPACPACPARPAGRLQQIKDALGPGQDIDAVRIATCGSSGTTSCPMAGPSSIRPPALVTEYLAAGSLRSALARRADFLRSPVVRVKLCLDCARVGDCWGLSLWLVAGDVLRVISK
jgi:hypothetical protein